MDREIGERRGGNYSALDGRKKEGEYMVNLEKMGSGEGAVGLAIPFKNNTRRTQYFSEDGDARTDSSGDGDTNCRRG